MSNNRAVTLKPTRERSLKNRHPWVFSGAINKFPEFNDGEILAVLSSTGEHLGYGYFNHEGSLVGRMLSFTKEDPIERVRLNIRDAVARRKARFDESVTNCWRVINGEGDDLPGVVVDRYADVVVLQLNTRGAELLRPIIVEELAKALSPRSLIERSISASREEEGLNDHEAILSGDAVREVVVRENGMSLLVSFEHSQKTGFFLDQREMRSLVRDLSKEKRMLNCFSFTGAFSVASAMNRASTVSVDISKDAIAIAKRNFELNSIDTSRHQFVVEDVFKYLRDGNEQFDLIVLDPPAFAKKKAQVAQAAKGYNEINRTAIQRVAPGGILVTCSCSYHVDTELFQKIIFSAARDAGRAVRIIQRHRLAMDHPVSVFHPEGEYLKSLVVEVG